MSITLIERVLEIYPKRMQFPFHSYITKKKKKKTGRKKCGTLGARKVDFIVR